MNSNLKNQNCPPTTMNVKITQLCMSCNTPVSEKILYDWIDPADNIFGFKLIMPYRRIFSLAPQLYPMKMTIECCEQLYYNVLCVKCTAKSDHWYCLSCNKTWSKDMKKCELTNVCLLCIEKEKEDDILDCSCDMCSPK